MSLKENENKPRQEPTQEAKKNEPSKLKLKYKGNSPDEESSEKP